jgi:hypothetical protein
MACILSELMILKCLLMAVVYENGSVERLSVETIMGGGSLKASY